MYGPVLIAGGGIGGLTTALALARAAFKVEIFEQAPMLAGTGAGLQISPNASRILGRLEIMPRLEEYLGYPESLRIYSGTSGKLLAQMPLGSVAEERWGAPYAVAHRSDLQKVLFEACDAEKNITLHLGSEIDSYSLLDGLTLSYIQNGTAKQVKGNALIGADGIRSRIREQFLKDGPPPFSGYSAYRAIIPAGTLAHKLQGNMSGLWLAPDAHIVHYPLRGNALINIVVILRESIAEDDDQSENLKRVIFATAHLSSHAKQLLRAPESWSRWPIYHRPIDLRPWPLEPVTLLGDAAHPMLPFLAQGAAQAIEDADILSSCLAHSPDSLAQAFVAYRNKRAARVAKIIHESKRNTALFHMCGSPARVRDLVLRVMRGEQLMKRYDWLYGQ